MKKLTVLLLALVLVCSCAIAETVNVTISDGQGKIVVASEALEVTDADADGAITICDALYAAHEAAYEGGAPAGFVTSETDYGISILRLWGEENGGSYGYYVNNASAYSLTDPVQDGDSVHAFVYTDLEAWSDLYCYFDKEAAECAAGENIELLLNVQMYDADWNPVLTPVEGAVVTIDGADSAFVTDADGNVSISFDAAGTYLVSARSDAMNLVPPVCIVTVK